MKELLQATKFLLIFVFLLALLTWGYAEASEFSYPETQEYVDPGRGWCDDSLAVGTILASNHPGSKNNWNEDQWPSAYLQCNGWTVGFYENSYSKVRNDEQYISWMFGYEHTFAEAGAVDLSWTLGVVNGYPKNWKPKLNGDVEVISKRWLPWGSLNVTVGDVVKFWVLPGYSERDRRLKIAVVGVGLEYNFW